MAMASVYAYLKQPVKCLWVPLYLSVVPTPNNVFVRWGPGKHPVHTVHVDDVAGAMWACAEWIDRVGGRTKANEIAGEEIPFRNDKSKAAQVPAMAPPDQKIVAPLFHLVGDQRWLNQVSYYGANYTAYRRRMMVIWTSPDWEPE